ncbi:hypothetical protein GUITHDRAFT_104173 [Guillardia theta CCMP2712]|uniref:2OG-Fe(II) oxygenase n=2 Tax=Guillardia theta TaxID=55529 RepID=L1JQB3_GUITC|nr:hypothetical protein GUITHDRAFT_104173 [Guillardia theta CCMP2712]EKX50365.1 hypothetical protein GUITHDRAFT_104173 [Guillardia theta CCMP2712]|eukprot:XP_005837345.1 hypothetical protein GUITHDRAFT_104173 [Guillardia theta CCMP2712]
MGRKFGLLVSCTRFPGRRRSAAAWSMKRNSRELSMKPSTRSVTVDEESLAEIRRERYFGFDTQQYPFQDAVRSVLGIDESVPFGDLHQVTEWYVDNNNFRMSKFQKMWNADRDRSGRYLSVSEGDCKSYGVFDEIYHRFIREVVSKVMGGGALQFQRAPTLRVMVPAECGLDPRKSTTKMHTDMEYHHQPSEINFWLPLSPVWDTNSLWIESEPGKGDFHPIELEYGSFCRFYGNQCRHFTKPNLTQKTRVSLDFRVVSETSGGHDPSFRK